MYKRRPIAILVLLLACLVFIGTLGWQAWQAQRSNATVAANVIRDYSALAADEFERRLASSLGSWGHKTLIKAIENAGSTREMLELIDTAPSDYVRTAAQLSTAFFIYDGTRLDISGAPPSEELVALIAGLRDTYHDYHPPFQYTYTANSGEQVVYLFRFEGDGEPVLFGYVLDPAGIVRFIEIMLGFRPLLPESLAGGRVDNEMLFIEVLNPLQRPVYRVNLKFENELAASKDFAPDLVGGMLDGYSVRVSLDPYAASELIIGGLPESRLPALLAALVAASMLLMSAIWLFVRESAVMNMREEFVSQVSHELRTPLTQIRMFAETLLLERTRSPEEQRRSLAIIDRESRRLSHLVENVLRISKVSDEIQLDCSDEALEPLLRDIGDTAQSIYPAVTIDVSIEGDPQARVDRNALRQVVINLLDNAIKYGPEGQRIVVTAKKQDGVSIVSIEDQGAGIPEAEHARVWDTFYRLGRERHTAIGGTGIGLAVVRKLVTAMHGRCWIETPDTGVGTRVVVEFPATAGDD
ncbi:MAG: ATP-binding protein [Pseudomonadota bacterium]